MENLKIPKETRHKLEQSIKRYFAENLEEEIGDLKASLLLDFVLEEIGPHIYNRAIDDAQAYLHEKVTDMENSCFALEGTYWKRQREHPRG